VVTSTQDNVRKSPIRNGAQVDGAVADIRTHAALGPSRQPETRSRQIPPIADGFWRAERFGVHASSPRLGAPDGELQVMQPMRAIPVRSPSAWWQRDIFPNDQHGGRPCVPLAACSRCPGRVLRSPHLAGDRARPLQLNGTTMRKAGLV
jgi:hypothetical protein